jgi:hypothetical protein
VQGPRELDEYSGLREVASARTAKERAESLVLDKDIAGMKTRIEEMNSEEAFTRQEKENSENYMAEYVERKAKLQEAVKLGHVEKQELARERDSLVKLTVECENAAAKLNAEYEEVSVTLQDAGDARRATR